MKLKITLATFALGLCALIPPALHAASHTWSGAVNGLWSNAGNWSSGGVPVLGESSLSLTFPVSATRTVMTNDIGALTVNAMNFQGSNYVLRGASTITFGSSLINVLCGGTSNVIESPLNLPGGFAVSVSDNRVMAFHTLVGAGYLVKFGEGEVHLRGGAANTLSGGYTVNVGTLSLQKTGGATAVASDLTIVGTTNLGQYASVRLESSEQIAGNVNVIVHPSGLLSMNNCTNTINDLTVMSGTVWLGGLLRLNGDVYLSGTDNPFPTPDLEPQIDVDLEFLGASSTITVSNLTCDIAGSIVEYGTATAINKTGPGVLALKGTANNYTGALNINQGRVIADHSSALGTIAGTTVVAAGATLELRGGGINSSEAISLTGLGVDGQGALQAFSGAHTLSGGITLSGETGMGVNGSGNSLNLNGVVGGAGGIRKLGDGTLTLSGFGNNGFSGASWVAGGRLNLSKSAGVRAIGSVTVTNGAQLHFTANEQMDNAGLLSLYSAAICNLTNRSETLGGLNFGRGITLDTGTGTLTLLGNVYVGPPYTTAGGSTTIRGSLSLGGATRRFHAPDLSLRFDCVISDGSGVGGLSLNGGGGALGFGNFQFIRTNTFNGPITADYAGLFAHNPQSFGTTNAGIIGTNNCEIILFNDDLAVTGESLTSEQLVILYSTGTNAWNGPVFLANSNSILRFNPWTVGDTNTLTVNGSISGPGGLVLGDSFYYAPGMTVRLTQSNSYTGTTLVSVGTLAIQHPQGLGGAPQGTTVTAEGSLRLELPDGATVINEPLTFDPGSYGTNRPPGLMLAGAVSNNWNGPISMAGNPSRITVLNMSGTLVLNTAITGGGALAKTGPGNLILAGTGSNQISQLIAEYGPTTLAQTGGYAVPSGDVTVLGDDFKAFEGINYFTPATVQLDKPGQLPPFTTLNLVGPYGGISLNEQNLTIREVSGTGSLYTATGTLTFSNAVGEASYFHGRISSEYGARTNLIKLGAGSLFLNGPATAWYNGSYWDVYDSIGLYGTVQMQGGFLELTNGVIGSLQLAPGTITVARSAPVAGVEAFLQNGLQLGALSGSGDLALNDGSWVYVGNNDTSTEFSGEIDGGSPAKLIKTGTGALTLNGSGIAYTGSALVERGTLLVNTPFNCNILVQPEQAGMTATLGGTGQVQNVTLTGTGSRIAPGATTNTPSYGRLSVGNLILGAGTGYRCEIGGTNAGVNLDQIDASGTVTLSGGFADFTAFGAGVTSNRYAVVKSTVPVSGTFLGAAEGAYVYPAAGRFMVLTYLTAAGKEVTLIEQAGAPLSNINITGITNQPNGHITLTGTGNTGSTYFIEACTNLATTNWIPLGSVTGDWNGGISFTDTNAPNFPQRFYRFRLQ